MSLFRGTLSLPDFITNSEVIGGTRPHHLEDAVAALFIQLTLEEIKQMEEDYVPHTVLGYV